MQMFSYLRMGVPPSRRRPAVVKAVSSGGDLEVVQRHDECEIVAVFVLRIFFLNLSGQLLLIVSLSLDYDAEKKYG